MRDRLPMIFSTTGLLVAVLGVTPLGDGIERTSPPSQSLALPESSASLSVRSDSV